MAIHKYGLDAAEIENLKAAHLTDDEINDLNKKRVQEQMEDETEVEEDMVEQNPELKRISALMPGAHKAIVGYIATSPNWITKRTDDGYIKQAFKKISDHGLQEFNKTLNDVFKGIEDADNLDYDFSEENMEDLSKQRETLINKATVDADKVEELIAKDQDALLLSGELIRNLIG